MQTLGRLARAEDLLLAAKELTQEELRDALRLAESLYHNGGTSPLTDAQYDALLALAGEGPVGAPVASRAKVALPVWMGSLDKVKTREAIDRWTARHPGPYLFSDKLDGVSALLLPGGRLYTRGDGRRGEDISRVLRYLDLPQVTSVVRGELVIPRVEEALIRGKNLRNTVAGAIGAKTPDASILAKVHFVAYELVGSETPSRQLRDLADMGFRVPWHVVGVPRVETLQETLRDRRSSSPYHVDGIVVAQDVSTRRVDGANPEHMVAFKSDSLGDFAEALVTDVTWDVSKHNLLKPVVHFEAVTLSGVTISKATGFNALFVQQRGIGPGARIRVTRSGDVIPHISEVLEAAAPKMPQQSYAWTDGGKDVVASDGASDALAVARLAAFFKSVGGDGLGEKTLLALYNAGHTDVGRLLALRPRDISGLPGMGERSAEIVCAALQQARQATTVELMAASSAFGRGFAARKLGVIVEALGATSVAGLAADAHLHERLLGVPGVSEKTASQFVAGLGEFALFLRESGLGPNGNRSFERREGGALQGTTVVFSGFRDKALEALVVAKGGRVGSSVTAETTLVVASAQTSGKVDQARKRGIRVVAPEVFAEMLR